MGYTVVDVSVCVFVFLFCCDRLAALELRLKGRSCSIPVLPPRQNTAHNTRQADHGCRSGMLCCVQELIHARSMIHSEFETPQAVRSAV